MVTGKMTSYNTMLFTLESKAGEQHRVLWNMIPADRVDRYWRYLESPAIQTDAVKLLELGEILTAHPQGKKLASKAFAQVLALDPSLKKKVENARSGRRADGSPRFIGTGDPKRWGELSAEQMEQGTQSLVAFSKRAEKQMGIGLKLYQSERFMLLSDAEPKAIAGLSEKLTRFYRSITQVLQEDPDGNMFYGKCLVVLFNRRVDYVRFHRLMYGTDARGTGGLCHGFGDGQVHIALFRRTSSRQTYHILAHELTHACLHRYKRPARLPEWINEGLAEHIAHTLEPPPGSNPMLKSRLALQGKKGLGENFFENEPLAAWQYDVAGALTGYLIKKSRRNYPALIESIKKGQSAGDALQENYRMSPERLTLLFKKELDRALNKKLGQ